MDIAGPESIHRCFFLDRVPFEAVRMWLCVPKSTQSIPSFLKIATCSRSESVFLNILSGILRGVEVDGKRKTNWNIYPMEFKPNLFERYVLNEASFSITLLWVFFGCGKFGLVGWVIFRINRHMFCSRLAHVTKICEADFERTELNLTAKKETQVHEVSR